jgi:hypothetical protein
MGSAVTAGAVTLPSDELWMAMALQVGAGKHWLVHHPTLIINPGNHNRYANSFLDGIYVINPANVPLSSTGPIMINLSTGPTLFGAALQLLQGANAVKVDDGIPFIAPVGAQFSLPFGNAVGTIMRCTAEYIVVPSGCAIAAFAVPLDGGGLPFQLNLNYEYLQRDNSEC